MLEVHPWVVQLGFLAPTVAHEVERRNVDNKVDAVGAVLHCEVDTAESFAGECVDGSCVGREEIQMVEGYSLPGSAVHLHSGSEAGLGWDLWIFEVQKES